MDPEYCSRSQRSDPFHAVPGFPGGTIHLTDFNLFDARADPLTLDFLGTDTAGDIRQGVGGLYQFKVILARKLNLSGCTTSMQKIEKHVIVR